MKTYKNGPLIGTDEIKAINNTVMVPPKPIPAGIIQRKCSHAGVDELNVARIAVPTN
jgi:hypothetical protein